jgi:methyl-accepting chemotaxis protein
MFMGNDRGTFSIKRKFLLFSVILFVVILGGGTAAFITSMRGIMHSSTDESLSQMLKIKHIQLVGSVDNEIAIALTMAGSPLIQNYFQHPEDPDLEKLAFTEIAGYRKAFAGNTVFWINDIDKKFYSDDAYSYTVDPSNPDDYWYNMTLFQNEAFNFNINYNDNIKKTMLWINATVKVGGKGIGIVGTGIDLTGFISSLFSDLDPAVTLYLFNDSGEITGARDSRLVASKKRLSDQIGNSDEIINAAKNLGKDEVRSFDIRNNASAVGVIPELGWYIFAHETITSDMYLKTSMTGLFVVVMIVILAVFIIVYLFISGILRPLDYTIGVLKEISANWDLTKRVEIKNKDEIGDLAGFLNLTFDTLKSLVMVIKQETASLFNTGEELAHNVSGTASAINEITANIESMKVQTEKQSSSAMTTGSAIEKIMQSIDSLNENITVQSESVSKSSIAIEEMLENTHAVVEILIQNTANVNTLSESSELGRAGLQTVSEDIREIARESAGLLEINAVMENIASQTNLLSMNAAIEAAHAGEAGKGFAVVADEIRKLAESSSEQSKTIGGILKKIKSSIDTITSSTDIVLKRFESIEQEVKTVSDQEAGIRAAIEEQERGSKGILDSIGQLNTITEQVKSASAAMAHHGRKVIHQSTELENITREIARGMDEMAEGAGQINAEVININEISGVNTSNISSLATEVAKFKVE